MQTRLMPRFTRARRVESAKADSAFRFAEDTVNVYGQRWTRRTKPRTRQLSCWIGVEWVN